MKTLKEKMHGFYETKLKKHKDCPVCKGAGAMLADNKNKAWVCKDCGYSITYEKLDSGYIYWFCDGCEAFLNIQPGFEEASETWICQECGFENAITEECSLGQCKDCRKAIPSDAEVALCDECRQVREARRAENLQKAKELAAKAGKMLLATALIIIKNAVKKAVQTYLTDMSSGNSLNKEAHTAAATVAKDAAMQQMSADMQGLIISKFGNLGDWLTQQVDCAIKQLA